MALIITAVNFSQTTNEMITPLQASGHAKFNTISYLGGIS